jgi:hypothetical protein
MDVRGSSVLLNGTLAVRLPRLSSQPGSVKENALLVAPEPPLPVLPGSMGTKPTSKVAAEALVAAAVLLNNTPPTLATNPLSTGKPRAGPANRLATSSRKIRSGLEDIVAACAWCAGEREL